MHYNQKKNISSEVSITRRFNVIVNEAFIGTDFSLNNLTGSGRVDVVCRIISSTFFLSNAFRKNTELNLLFKKTSQKITISGNRVRGINPDERAIAGVIKRIFTGNKPYLGIKVTNIDWNSFLSKLEGYLLLEDSPELSLENTTLDQITFTLGDQRGFSDEDLGILRANNNLEMVSLGNISYLTSNCISIVHYLFDKLMKKM